MRVYLNPITSLRAPFGVCLSLKERKKKQTNKLKRKRKRKESFLGGLRSSLQESKPHTSFLDLSCLNFVFIVKIVLACYFFFKEKTLALGLES